MTLALALTFTVVVFAAAFVAGYLTGYVLTRLTDARRYGLPDDD